MLLLFTKIQLFTSFRQRGHAIFEQKEQ